MKKSSLPLFLQDILYSWIDIKKVDKILIGKKLDFFILIKTRWYSVSTSEVNKKGFHKLVAISSSLINKYIEKKLLMEIPLNKLNSSSSSSSSSV